MVSTHNDWSKWERSVLLKKREKVERDSRETEKKAERQKGEARTVEEITPRILGILIKKHKKKEKVIGRYR